MTHPSYAPYGFDSTGVIMDYCDTEEFQIEQRVNVIEALGQDNTTTINEIAVEYAFDYADAILPLVEARAKYHVLALLTHCQPEERHSELLRMLEELDEELEMLEADEALLSPMLSLED